MNDTEKLYDAVAEYRSKYPERMWHQTLRCHLRHPNAKLPTRGTPGSAGLDLYAAYRIYGEEQVELGYDTGVAVEIPPGYVGLVFPRSSIKSTGIRLCNGVGVIDQDFRGTIKAFFDRRHIDGPMYHIGDRIAQLVIVPYLSLEPVAVDELSQTERGTGGFGSTDSKAKADAELKSYTKAVTE